MDTSNVKSIHWRQKLPGTLFTLRVLKRPMNPEHGIRLASLALTLAITALTLRASAGEDKSAADPTSTWKITHAAPTPQAGSSELTLKLKLNGGELTGTLSSVSKVKHKPRVKELPIKEAKLQGDEISFTVTRPSDAWHEAVTSIYQGKISGDTIKGTFKVEVLGQTFTRDWEAERLKDLSPGG